MQFFAVGLCGVVGAPRRASPQPPLVCTTSARRRWRDNYVVLQNYKCASFETWGVGAEVNKEGGRDVWYVEAHTDMLTAGHERLRKALAEIVKKAIKNGWVDAGKAEGWLEKLEKGRVLKEGWPKYLVRLSSSDSLEVRFRSPNPDSIRQEVRRLREMGLKEGKHFAVKMPEGGGVDHVYILRK